MLSHTDRDCIWSLVAPHTEHVVSSHALLPPFKLPQRRPGLQRNCTVLYMHIMSLDELE